MPDESGAELCVLILGRQGAGKGLIGRLVAARLEGRFVSTGDVLRAELENYDRSGRNVGFVMDRGGGWPLDISYEVLRNALSCEPRASLLIVDGIPRRADEIDRVRALFGREPSKVIVLDIPTLIAVERLRNRWTCPDCGLPHGPGWPAKDNRCNFCMAELARRADDSPDGIKLRHEVWGLEARAIISHYETLGVASTIRAGSTGPRGRPSSSRCSLGGLRAGERIRRTVLVTCPRPSVGTVTFASCLIVPPPHGSHNRIETRRTDQ